MAPLQISSNRNRQIDVDTILFMTLRQLSAEPPSIPTRTSWYLSELTEARGKQELYTLQSPQKLNVLREHALTESAVSSNRIEGVEVDKSRVATLIFGSARVRDREEVEVRGYRNALNLIHERGAKLPVTIATIKKLHSLCRGEEGDAGQWKEKPVDIIQTYPDGRSRVRFRSVSPEQTQAAMEEMIELWNRGLKERWVHPFILAAALNLDFLCIHPFRDGNGRVSRLLFLLACYHCGLEVGRYISLERIVEENKERYYEVLEMSSTGWHEGKHDGWAMMNFLLWILTQACKEFEQRVGQLKSPKGEKTAMVLAAVEHQLLSFRVADIQRECPGVSLDWIRQIMDKLRKEGKIECLGTGHTAKWQKIGN